MIMAPSRVEALAHRDFALAWVKLSGSLVNPQKSNLSPLQQLTFFGLHWDTQEGSVGLTDEKVIKLQSAAQCLLDTCQPWVWDIQKFLGIANFTAFAVPCSCLCPRLLQQLRIKTLKFSLDFFRLCSLPEDARQEPEWYLFLMCLNL